MFLAELDHYGPPMKANFISTLVSLVVSKGL
jgi:hypothetical protein